MDAVLRAATSIVNSAKLKKLFKVKLSLPLLNDAHFMSQSNHKLYLVTYAYLLEGLRHGDFAEFWFKLS